MTTTIIRDENGNEDIVQGSTKLPTRNSIIVEILFEFLFLILIFWSFGFGGGIFMFLGFIFIGYLGIFGGGEDYYRHRNKRCYGREKNDYYSSVA